MDIHKYEQMYETELRTLKKSGISEKNKELILKFNDELIIEGLSKPRLILYINKLKVLARRLNKDFDKAKVEDIKRLVSDLQQRDYSPWTKQTYKVVIRRFYTWLKEASFVDWVNIKISRSEKRLPSEGDLLTEEDVKKLISSAEHPRDKAFISMLWESGARIGELGNLSIKNVCFDKHGVILSLRGKTGARKIRLISSTPYISTWLNMHPFKDDPSSAVWINTGCRNHNQNMKYSAMCILVKNLFHKAGLKKRCNPHMFRHSRATFMADHLTEFQMNQYFGWVQGSDMPATYVHMSGKNVDDAILRMNGVITETKEEVQQKPRICLKCETINAYDSKHCNKCGGILDLKYAMEMETERKNADDMMAKMLEDPRIKEMIFAKMKELKGVF